jgi:hypothetical protein
MLGQAGGGLAHNHFPIRQMRSIVEKTLRVRSDLTRGIRHLNVPAPYYGDWERCGAAPAVGALIQVPYYG